MKNLAARVAVGCAVVLAAVLLAGVVPVAFRHADAATEILLSADRPVSASSVEGEGLAPGNVVDGDPNTRWASAPGKDPQWIVIDLGVASTITRVRLSWETAYARAYEIQVSADGSGWRTIFGTDSGNGGTDNVKKLSASGRYLRVYGTARGTVWGYSLWEVRVYGRPDGNAPSHRPSPGWSGSPAPTPTPTARPTTPVPTGARGPDLTDPGRKEIALELVSSAENSTLDWRSAYAYIEDIGDGRGYTGGIMGFCSGTGDMIEVVRRYTALSPGNRLAKYLPALERVNGTASHAGLDPGFPADWRAAASDRLFQRAQDEERDTVYFGPAVAAAKADGLRALGQFIYFDAMVMHGPGEDPVSFGGIRRAAMARARTPAQGGDEVSYLNAFLDARVAAMRTEEAHSDTSRVDTAKRVFLSNGNLTLAPPLHWKVYGDSYSINR